MTMAINVFRCLDQHNTNSIQLLFVYIESVVTIPVHNYIYNNISKVGDDRGFLQTRQNKVCRHHGLFEAMNSDIIGSQH